MRHMRMPSYIRRGVRTKVFHDKKPVRKTFEVEHKVLLFDSRLKLFPGKLKSRWCGPFELV